MSTLFHCNTCQDAFWYLDCYLAKYHLRKANCLTFLDLNLPQLAKRKGIIKCSTCLAFLFVLSWEIGVVLCFLLLEGSVSSCLLRCQT